VKQQVGLTGSHGAMQLTSRTVRVLLQLCVSATADGRQKLSSASFLEYVNFLASSCVLIVDCGWHFAPQAPGRL
jgi:hypothetical protein